MKANAGAIVNPDAKIGRGCIIDTCAFVDHDCIIEDYSHIAIGVHLSGNIRVGWDAWLGAGSMVKNNIDICSECMVGARAVVVKNLSESGTCVDISADRMHAGLGKPGNLGVELDSANSISACFIITPFSE